jgi:hypothetical protein
MTAHTARSALRALTSITGLIILACAQPDRVLAPPTAPRFTISDGKNGGTKGFYFLPPLVPPPQVTGAFDPALAPEISVCELTATSCGAELAHFTMSTTPAITLDLKGEAYYLAWQTKDGHLVDGHSYRLTVLVGAHSLGYADLAVVASPGDLKSVAEGFIGLVEDHTINVRFRIETGIVASVSLTPSAAVLGISATKAFTVQGVDLHGVPIAISDPIAWSASNSNITVSSGGVVTAVSAGTANVIANVNGLQATAAIEVIHQLLFGVTNTTTATDDLLLLTAGLPPAFITSIAGLVLGDFAWRPDGARIAYGSITPGPAGVSEIFTMNANATGVTQITPSNDGRAAAGASWSPDGTKIAFVSMVAPSDYLQFGEIWIMDADGGNAHAILSAPGHHLTLPVWSPDGAHIAFKDAFDVRMMNPDGSNVTTLVTLPSPGLLWRQSWSPDSHKIVVTACPTACGLYTIDVAAKTLTPLLAASGTSEFLNPDWSPDGERIGFVRRDPGPVYAIEMIHPDGTGRVSLWQGTASDLFVSIAWRP